MKVELPEFKRCCCCIPLRYGLLGWGYIKLIISLVVILDVVHDIRMLMYFMYIQEVIIIIVIEVIFMLLVLLDVCFNIVFLIGGHRKSLKLLRASYIYSIVFLCITTLLTVAISTINLHHWFTTSHEEAEMTHEFISVAYVVQALIFVLLNLAVQAYIILLIRSEVNKLANNCNFRFENMAQEVKCIMENVPYGLENEKNENENGINGPKNATNEIDNQNNDYLDETVKQNGKKDCESYHYRRF